MQKKTQYDPEHIQQAILEREIDEELSQEKWINFFNKYKNIIGCIIFVTLTSVIVFNIYQTWWHKVKVKESHLFEKAVLAVHEKQKQQALKLLDEAKNNRTSYKYLSLFRKSALLIEENDLKGALNILDSIQKDNNAPSIFKDIALLLSIGHQANTEKPEILQTKLIPLLRPDNFLFAQASQQAALLSLKQNDIEKAKAYINSALKTSTTHPNIAIQLKELLTILERK